MLRGIIFFIGTKVMSICPPDTWQALMGLERAPEPTVIILTSYSEAGGREPRSPGGSLPCTCPEDSSVSWYPASAVPWIQVREARKWWECGLKCPSPGAHPTDYGSAFLFMYLSILPSGGKKKSRNSETEMIAFGIKSPGCFILKHVNNLISIRTNNWK